MRYLNNNMMVNCEHHLQSNGIDTIKQIRYTTVVKVNLLFGLNYILALANSTMFHFDPYVLYFFLY